VTKCEGACGLIDFMVQQGRVEACLIDLLDCTHAVTKCEGACKQAGLINLLVQQGCVPASLLDQSVGKSTLRAQGT
jgi:hypothetical protein